MTDDIAMRVIRSITTTLLAALLTLSAFTLFAGCNMGLLRAESRPVQSTNGAEPVIKAVGVLLMDTAGTVFRINYVRQFTEVAIALLFTFGLLRALKLRKPAGD